MGLGLGLARCGAGRGEGSARNGLQVVGRQVDDLLELHIFDTEVLDEVGEDALELWVLAEGMEGRSEGGYRIGLDCVPAGHGGIGGGLWGVGSWSPRLKAVPGAKATDSFGVR